MRRFEKKQDESTYEGWDIHALENDNALAHTSLDCFSRTKGIRAQACLHLHTLVTSVTRNVASVLESGERLRPD